VIGNNDPVLIAPGPFDSIEASFNGLKGNSCAVKLVGHQTRQALDDFFLNSQSRGIKPASKACPRDTCPNDGAAP